MKYKEFFHFVRLRFSCYSLFLLLFMVLFVNPIKGQIYVSPGVQLSMDSKHGFTFSLQVTIGQLTNFGIPGFTVGVRTNSVQRTRFADLQFIPPITPFVGFGFGTAIVTDKQTGSIQRMKRGKLWLGAFGLITIDDQWNKKEKQTNFGVIGVLTRPLGGNFINF